MNASCCRHTLSFLFVLGGFCLALSASAAYGADEAVEQQRQKLVDSGLKFLTSQQADDGSFSKEAGIGPTALAIVALVQNGRSSDDPAVAKALAYLEQFVQQNGGIHPDRSRIPNYETCIALLAFQAANTGGKYNALIAGADRSIRAGIWDESQQKEKDDPYYGGAGYGGSTRPDLSNTAFMVDALHAAGADSDDEDLQKAIVFISRCQNLESEHNTLPLASKVNDGGFYYTPIVDAGRPGPRGAGGPEGGLRSYGSMTYNGLKSMLYAGLTPDDPRFKAALAWIGKHYNVEANPGMGDAGLYYYYHTFAKTLDALGQPELTDAEGMKHAWRTDLIGALAKRQKTNGAWVNDNQRWFEGDANLATSFALIALSYCAPPAAN